MESLRNLDLEALAGRKLKDDMSIGENRVDKLVIGIETHHTDILDKVRIVRLELRHGLIIDQAGIGVIDGTVSADNKLRNVGEAGLVALATELGVGVDDGGDALGRIETSDLDNVFAGRPVKLSPTNIVSSSRRYLSHGLLTSAAGGRPHCKCVRNSPSPTCSGACSGRQASQWWRGGTQLSHVGRCAERRWGSGG